MKQRRLGRTGLVVSEIGLGTMTFGIDGRRGGEPRASSTAPSTRGVDFLDVAEVYPVPPDAKWAGAARRSSASGWPDGRATRCSSRRRSRGRGAAGSRRRSATARAASIAITSSAPCEDSLRRLGTDYIDLYQTHWPDPDVPIEETIEALDRLVDEGKIRDVGCSNETAYGLTESLWKSDRHGYAPLRDDPEQLQPAEPALRGRARRRAVAREQVSLLPYSPLAGGVLSGKYQGGAWPAGARFTLLPRVTPRTKVMTARFVNEHTLAATARFAALAARVRLSRR